MKITLISFTIIAGFVSVMLFSCSKPAESCTPNEDSPVGGYNGEFSILAGAYKFDDSLTITNTTAGDRKISIKTGTFEATNCNRVIIDTVKIVSQTIETVTLKNIVAVGSGTISGNTISTVINIKSGTATIGSLPAINLATQALTGTFTK